MSSVFSFFATFFLYYIFLHIKLMTLGKRLGLHSKTLIAVPNHLTEQMGQDFLKLYPGANILVAKDSDFTKENRQKLTAKIATGDFDAIIVGHSQLIKIPVSREREENLIKRQINEIVDGISDLKFQRGDNFTIKQLEKTKKTLETKLDKLTNSTARDDVVNFEELGIDKMIVDEAHQYKNLFVSTKMRNISGISTNDNVQKTQDLYMKCQYLDEITGGKGTVFATGTPVSNSMTEIFTMMKYLQSDTLKEKGLQNFDSWAANFGETVTATELAPEGTGYRQKTRFAKFFNLPELMSLFKECADIKTADTLNLPVPLCTVHNVAVKPTEVQKELVSSLSERASIVHQRLVPPEEDNMLKIATDGRKIGLDQRLIDPMLPDEEGTKVNACIKNVFDIWDSTKENSSTQIVFCDFSTPKEDGSFNVYDDIRNKLVAKGIPKEEIKFIHEAKNEEQKEALFADIRSGKVRILLGSTQKLGTGTNIQDKLIASHDLDCGWKPSDQAQRLGRMVRQGNENKKVDLYRYVTEQTFDSYLYQTLENKQKFIGQIMTSKAPVRSCEDVDEQALSYAEVKALCAGNPLIKEKMELDIEVAKLKMMKASFTNTKFNVEDKVLKEFPNKIASSEARIMGLESEINHLKAYPEVINKDGTKKFYPMTIGDKVYSTKKEASEELQAAVTKALTSNIGKKVKIGEYKSFDINVFYDVFAKQCKVELKKDVPHVFDLSESALGNIIKIDNILCNLSSELDTSKQALSDLENQLQNAQNELTKPFPYDEDLKTKTARQSELSSLLDLNNTSEEGTPDETEPQKKPSILSQLNDIKITTSQSHQQKKVAEMEM